MYMAYTSNPHIPEVRMEAVRLVHLGWSIRKVGRHLGFAHNTILNWLDRAPAYGKYGRLVIPTRSSRPLHHPRELPQDVVSRILVLRAERNECAEILHHRLCAEGTSVSLSSVKRVLKRFGCSRYSRWKKWHQYPPRPVPEKPGALVQIDTIHDGAHEDRLYVYTLLDVCSRFACAAPSLRINCRQSLKFIEKADSDLPFSIQTLQSDHGSEFSKYFTTQIGAHGIAHRHSRVRQPNDNAHLERFNRTIQEQCLSRLPRRLAIWRKEIPEYLRWYNQERPHMGLQYKTPLEVVRSY